MGIHDRDWYRDAITRREAANESHHHHGKPAPIRPHVSPRDKTLKRIEILVKIALWLGVIAFLYNRARHIGLL